MEGKVSSQMGSSHFVLTYIYIYTIYFLFYFLMFNLALFVCFFLAEQLFVLQILLCL
jgi:hypothetical protein